MPASELRKVFSIRMRSFLALFWMVLWGGKGGREGGGEGRMSGVFGVLCKPPSGTRDLNGCTVCISDKHKTCTSSFYRFPPPSPLLSLPPSPPRRTYRRLSVSTRSNPPSVYFLVVSSLRDFCTYDDDATRERKGEMDEYVWRQNARVCVFRHTLIWIVHLSLPPSLLPSLLSFIPYLGRNVFSKGICWLGRGGA